MTDSSSYPVTEREFLEDNIATVAFHLGQPGARLAVSHSGPGLIVGPGEVLKEISRRLTRDDAQPPLGPCTQAELDAGFDAKNALLVSMWMDRALKAEAAAQGVWQPIKTIPQDRPIDGWHKAWKCPVTIAYRSWGDRSAWVEKTLTTEWPIEAFTHWRETSAAPSVSSTHCTCTPLTRYADAPHEPGCPLSSTDGATP